MTRAIVHGAGRMARRILALIQDSEGLELAGIVSRSQPEEDFGVDWFNSLEALNTPADLLIDFTLPGGTGVAARWCAANKVALLSGTTGLTDEDVGALKKTAMEVPVLSAPNLSHGVALITALVRQAAGVLGVRANVSISDIHHRHKLDAPSGTAMALASAVMEGRSERLQELLSAERLAGMCDAEEGELGFSSVREGEVVGEHTVSFTLPDEVIEITHKALNRDVFAGGAIKAGKWLVEQTPGYYSTADWLGIR